MRPQKEYKVLLCEMGGKYWGSFRLVIPEYRMKNEEDSLLCETHLPPLTVGF